MPRSAGAEVCPPRVASAGLASESFATGGLPSRPHFLVLLPHPHASPPPTPWASSSTAHCSPLHTATCPVLNQQAHFCVPLLRRMLFLCSFRFLATEKTSHRHLRLKMNWPKQT